MFCANCGHRLGEGHTFCEECGASVPEQPEQTDATQPTAPVPAAAAAPVAGEPEPRERSKKVLLWVVAVVAIAVVGVLAFMITRLIVGGDDGEATSTTSGAAATSTTQPDSTQPATTGAGGETTTTADDGGDSTTTAAPPDTTEAGSDCTAIAAGAAAEVAELAEEWDDYTVTELANTARLDPDDLPGLSGLERRARNAWDDADEAGCDPLDAEDDFEDALRAFPDSSGAGQVVLEAVDHGFGFEDQPSTAWGLAAALAAYPDPDEVPTLPSDIPIPSWVAILESLETGRTSESQAEAVADDYRDVGIAAEVLLSDDYASLNDGYWAVYVGTWDTLGEADAYCADIRRYAEICYGRFLMAHPGPAGDSRCGSYGRYEVTGTSSTRTLPVRGHPGSGYPIITSLDGNATGVLAVGESVRRQSIDWVPVVAGSQIGWVDGEYLAWDQNCPYPGGVGSLYSCAEVSAAGVDLAQDMLDALAGVSADEVYGGPPASFRPLETYAGELEARAQELGCPNRIRVAVQNGASGLQAQGEVARLVRELMRIEGLFNT